MMERKGIRAGLGINDGSGFLCLAIGSCCKLFILLPMLVQTTKCCRLSEQAMEGCLHVKLM